MIINTKYIACSNFCVFRHAGQVGYIICGMKSASEAHIGDTFYHVGQKVDVLPGFQPAQSMVFAGIFPVDTNDFRKLDDNIRKLTLNDASVSVHKETSHALGQGWRLGFLGTLHMDVFRQRLENVSGKVYAVFISSNML